MRLLLVEDDKDLSVFVREGLSREGFAVDLAVNGRQALEKTNETDYNVVLLDVMMPELDGYSVLRKLRAQGSRAAIIMVTCRGQEGDKLQGFSGGADDYIVKPFLLTELIARIRAILRRTDTSKSKGPDGSLLRTGPLSMDLLKRELKIAGKPVPLTKTEFQLLEYFMRRPNQVLSRSVLVQHLSASEANATTNTIEVHIKNLRHKIDGKSTNSLIRTVRSVGYSLNT